jgi:hypothetical protein
MERSQHFSRHAISIPHQPQHSSIGTFFKNVRKFDCFGLFRSNKLSPIQREERDKEKGELDKQIRKEKGLIEINKKLNNPVSHLVPLTNKKIRRRNEIVSVGSALESVVEES